MGATRAGNSVSGRLLRCSFLGPRIPSCTCRGVGGGAPWFQCWPSRVGGRVWAAGTECYPQGCPVATLSPEEVPAAPKAGVAFGIPVSRLRASLNTQRSGGGLEVTVASGLPWNIAGVKEGNEGEVEGEGKETRREKKEEKEREKEGWMGEPLCEKKERRGQKLRSTLSSNTSYGNSPNK